MEECKRRTPGKHNPSVCNNLTRYRLPRFRENGTKSRIEKKHTKRHGLQLVNSLESYKNDAAFSTVKDVVIPKQIWDLEFLPVVVDLQRLFQLLLTQKWAYAIYQITKF